MTGSERCGNCGATENLKDCNGCVGVSCESDRIICT